MTRKLKAGLTTTSKTPNEVQIRDTFETPKYAVDLLIPFIPTYITHVWECACGNGRIVQPLTEEGYSVYPSDIKKSNSWVDNHIYNFLEQPDETNNYDYSIWSLLQKNLAIITNPPFSVKDLFIEKALEFNVPFAFLINADYSGKTIDWIRKGCQKIVPTSRIAYLTPNILRRIHEGEVWAIEKKGRSPNYRVDEPIAWREILKTYEWCHNYKSIDDAPQELLYKYSSAQFHSMWLTYKFDLPSSEVFVDLPAKVRKENIR